MNAIAKEEVQASAYYDSVHPAAVLFPLMSDEDLDDLAKDISENGQTDPITLQTTGDHRTLLDGRNRIIACELAGVSPMFEEWRGKGSPTAFIISKNARRRHLTPSQAAMVAARILPLFEEEARERQATSEPGVYGGKPLSANLREGVDGGKAAAHAAKTVGVSPRSVEAAKTVITKAIPEVAAAVDSGTMSVSAAAKLAKETPEVQREAVAKVSFVVNTSGDYEWYTPSEYIEAARRVMGSIDTDPASCIKANETVKAKHFYTLEESGLDSENKWEGCVWLNPPYKMPDVSLFSKRLVEEFMSGSVSQGILLTHNSTDTAWWQHAAMHSQAICFTTGRINFNNNNSKAAAGPRQGQSFIYFGENVETFKGIFSAFGLIVAVMQ